MAKRNGGIIGKVNTPTTSTATGVWRLQDQYNARKNDIWPSTPYVADFLVIAGGGGGVFQVLVLEVLQVVVLVVIEIHFLQNLQVVVEVVSKFNI
jgi:uncharacterized membrane protein